MLYVIYRANDPELTYRGGQGPIVHLEADLHRVVAWADDNRRRWAFTLSNAAAVYAQFRSHLGRLGDINWAAVAATDFRPAPVKEGKQAEFLLHHSFPFELVERVGVLSRDIAQRASNAIHRAVHHPVVEIKQDWYY